MVLSPILYNEWNDFFYLIINHLGWKYEESNFNCLGKNTEKKLSIELRQSEVQIDRKP